MEKFPSRYACNISSLSSDISATGPSRLSI
jgi:hypothetical protein